MVWLRFCPRLPFDWRGPTAYLFAIIAQYVSTYFVAHIGVCTIGFVTATCWFLISLSVDIKESFLTMNENIKSDTNRCDLMRQFHELMELHSNAKQLSWNKGIVYFAPFVDDKRNSLTFFEGLCVNFLKHFNQSSGIYACGVLPQYVAVFYWSEWKALSICFKHFPWLSP